MRRRALLGGTLALAAGAGAAAAPRRYDVTPLSAAVKAPALQAVDLQGRTWRLSELRGRVVLLNFWATWCPPCRAEMPSMQQLAEIYGPEQLQVLAINVGEGLPRITRFLQASGLQLTVLLDPTSELSRTWAADALPTSYLIDAEGRPRFRLRGQVDWSSTEVTGLIDPLLGPSRRAT